MNQIIVYYNPYLPELKITVNGKRVSPYSALMRLRHQRLETWCETLFSEIYREVNSDYEVLCISNSFSCDWLREMARRHPHCLGFTDQPLPLDANVYERLEKLELLGCEEEPAPVMIPVLNASGDDAMTDAFYEILEEQGVFGDITAEGAAWYDCPLVNIELVTCASGRDLPYDVPFAIVLCGSEDDHISIDADIPVYAMIMGTKTEFLRRQGGQLQFTVDPDQIGDLLLNILEEEALCPLLSRLSYQFPQEALAMLTDAERDDLTLVCHGAPVCDTVLPKICDRGRMVPLELRLIPGDTDAVIRIESTDPSVLAADGHMLVPRADGEAEISVLIGSDPYPAVSEIIRVRSRRLIKGISLFPSALCLPEGGSEKLNVTLAPTDAENPEEIRWESSDPSVAAVDPVTGLIEARSLGCCRITASTQETAAWIRLEVQPEMKDIDLPGSHAELAVGEQREWRYRAVPENAYGADTLRVLTSNKNVADYRGGYILAKGVGECKIYFKTQNGGISRELRVSVRRSRRAW